MRKVSVVGGGNAGVFTALYFAWYGQDEVELIYNPEIPPERVGQATLSVEYVGICLQPVLSIAPLVSSLACVLQSSQSIVVYPTFKGLVWFGVEPPNLCGLATIFDYYSHLIAYSIRVVDGILSDFYQVSDFWKLFCWEV